MTCSQCRESIPEDRCPFCGFKSTSALERTTRRRAHNGERVPFTPSELSDAMRGGWAK